MESMTIRSAFFDEANASFALSVVAASEATVFEPPVVKKSKKLKNDER
jgi:hypothetical protein